LKTPPFWNKLSVTYNAQRSNTLAATAQGLSRLIAATTTAVAFDPIDMMGNLGLEQAQGLWLLNTDPTNIAYLGTWGVAATVNGDDMIPLVPRSWTWVAKPAYRKGVPPVISVPWSLIAATATCNVMVVADDAGWHPMV
jgi:hypothetical protein